MGQVLRGTRPRSHRAAGAWWCSVRACRMDDDLDAFVEAACRPLLEEWELRASSPPLRDETADGAQGGSAFELDSVALQFAAHVTDGDASAAGRTAPRWELALPACALIDSVSHPDAAAEAGPAAEALPGWRCLQSQHPVSCTRCAECSGRQRPGRSGRQRGVALRAQAASPRNANRAEAARCLCRLVHAAAAAGAGGQLDAGEREARQKRCGRTCGVARQEDCEAFPSLSHCDAVHLSRCAQASGRYARCSAARPSGRATRSASSLRRS